MTRSLDCGCQLTLVCCACTRNSSRKNLPCFRNILAQLCRILVIDYVILPTEDTDLLLSVKCSSALERLAACCLCIRHNQILHKSSVFRMSIHFCGLLSWIPHAVPEHAAVSDHIRIPIHQLKGSSSSIPSGMFMKPSMALDVPAEEPVS